MLRSASQKVFLSPSQWCVTSGTQHKMFSSLGGARICKDCQQIEWVANNQVLSMPTLLVGTKYHTFLLFMYFTLVCGKVSDCNSLFIYVHFTADKWYYHIRQRKCASRSSTFRSDKRPLYGPSWPKLIIKLRHSNSKVELIVGMCWQLHGFSFLPFWPLTCLARICRQCCTASKFKVFASFCSCWLLLLKPMTFPSL